MSSTERRGAPRNRIDVPVRIRSESDASGVAQLKSLSRLGALVEGGQTYRVGAPVTLCLELPGTDGETELRGEVIRVTPSGDLYAIAIFFAPLAWDTLVRLTSFLALHPTE
jgi:hypothetical protein